MRDASCFFCSIAVMAENSKFLLIVNPIAGGENKDPCLDYLKSLFDREKITYDLFETTGENDFSKAQEVIKKVQPKVVVAIGGDGTINLVAQLVRKTDMIFGIIPLGSANGLAVELGIPEQFERATEILLAQNVRPLDAILINKSYLSLHLSDIGLNAKVVKRFEEEKMRGMLGYIRQFISELFNLKPSKFDIVLDDKPAFTKKAHMIVLANATMYGTGIEVNPDGQLDDGLFEVCLIKPFRWYEFFPILFSFLFRQLHTSPHVKFYKCKTASIVNRDEEVLQVDGEIVGNPNTVDVEILPKAYQVIAPPKPTNR